MDLRNSSTGLLSVERLFGENQRAENSGAVVERGRNDIIVNAIRKFPSLYITVEQSGKLFSDQSEEVSLLHDAAADYDPLRRKCADPRNKPEREIIRFKRPRFVMLG